MSHQLPVWYCGALETIQTFEKLIDAAMAMWQPSGNRGESIYGDAATLVLPTPPPQTLCSPAVLLAAMLRRCRMQRRRYVALRQCGGMAAVSACNTLDRFERSADIYQPGWTLWCAHAEGLHLLVRDSPCNRLAGVRPLSEASILFDLC